jgi:hypothetical protein
MSDGGRDRASLAMEVSNSSQNVDAKRSAVRSIAWLDVTGEKQCDVMWRNLCGLATN